MKHVQRLLDAGWILEVKRTEFNKERPYLANVHNPKMPMNEVSAHSVLSESATEALFKLELYVALNTDEPIATAHETSNAPAPEPPEAQWQCTVCDTHNYSTETHCTQCEYSRMVCQEGKRIPRRGRNG